MRYLEDTFLDTQACVRWLQANRLVRNQVLWDRCHSACVFRYEADRAMGGRFFCTGRCNRRLHIFTDNPLSSFPKIPIGYLCIIVFMFFCHLGMNASQMTAEFSVRTRKLHKQTIQRILTLMRDLIVDYWFPLAEIMELLFRFSCTFCHTASSTRPRALPSWASTLRRHVLLWFPPLVENMLIRVAQRLVPNYFGNIRPKGSSGWIDA